MLVWDAGLIAMEVMRKKRKPLHEGQINQFYYIDEHLYSIGSDGWVRIWSYKTIDNADPPDDDPVLEMEPRWEFQFPGTDLMCIYKQNDDPESTLYYAQVNYVFHASNISNSIASFLCKQPFC